MNNRFLLSAMLLLVFFIISCQKEDISIDDPEIIEEESQGGIDTLFTADGVAFVRTPDDRFDNLPDWSYEAQYLEIDGLRQAYAEAGPADGEVVLLLHGQPSWSYLYRKMIPVLAEAGFRVIAMDHLGMGRSDKPVNIESYSYLGHANRLEAFIQGLGLQDINLFVQDWGSLIGLRVAGLNPDWFASIAVGNGDLILIPEGVQPFPPVENPNDTLDIPYPFSGFPDQQVPLYDGCDPLFDTQSGSNGFGDWITYAMKGVSFHASEVLESLTWFPMSDDVEAAYDAPYPSREYMTGVRVFPSLVNELPGLNQDAWAGLTSYEKPFLTIWGSNDAGAQGSCETQQKFINSVPGARGKPHDRLAEAGHFLQDDQGEEIARRLIDFYAAEWDNVPAESCPSDPTQDQRRYCEILLAYQRNGEIIAEVWGTQGLNNCPDQCLETLDLDAIKAENNALMASLNGPRIWLPNGNATFPDVEARTFGGLSMRLLASIPVDPDALTTGTVASLYEESVVFRNTTYIYPAGSMVYELTSTNGAVYTMQSVSLMTDSNLSVDDLPSLGARLSLPEGWSYQARMLEEDLILTVEGEAYVITDDLGNTY